MWLTYTWVLVVALAAADDIWLTYENDWTTDPRTGKQYKRHSVPSILTRARLQAACHKIGGFLPEPKDKEENDFLAELRSGLLLLPWLGMTQINGAWTWERDGTIVEWSNWYPLISKQKQNCAWLNDDGTWSDLMCDYAGVQSFICEKESTTKPGKTPKQANCNKCPSIRPYLPVCASNGYTYPHQCVLETWNCLNNQHITAIYEGECAPQNVCNNCPKKKTKTPVCGSNGYSYYHFCVLETWNCLRDQDIVVDHEGECLPHKPDPTPETTEKPGTTTGKPASTKCVDKELSSVDTIESMDLKGNSPVVSMQVKKNICECPCESDKQFGFNGTIIWVEYGCSAVFTVCTNTDVGFAAAKADGQLQPPALLMSVALGLCRLTHYM